MHTKGAKLLVIGALCWLFGLAGCSGNSRKLDRDIDRMSKDLSDLRTIQAEQTSVVSNLRDDLRRLSGRIDELEYAQNRTYAGSRVDPQLDQPTPISPRAVEPQLAPRLSVEIPQEVLELDEIYASRLPLSEGRSFLDGLAALKLGDLRVAEARFNEAVSMASGKEWSALALYWLGFSYEASQSLDRALSTYHEAAAAYPEHRRTPLILLGEARVFLALGDRESAKLTYQKLVNQFPRSQEAAEARGKLRTL